LIATKAINTCYLIICGPEEGVKLARERDHCADFAMVTLDSENWFDVQTNSDTNQPIPWTDKERHATGVKLMKEI